MKLRWLSLSLLVFFNPKARSLDSNGEARNDVAGIGIAASGGGVVKPGDNLTLTLKIKGEWDR